MKNCPIKWSGSKSPLSKEIISYFPTNNQVKKHTTFYELFCGGASVTLELLTNLDFNFKRNYFTEFICVDNNQDLIDLWKEIKLFPDIISNGYRRLWNDFNQKMENTIEGHRKWYFNFIRDQFNYRTHNRTESSIFFIFLLRTAFNGLVRFNSNGVYNSSCHFSRPGIHPDKLDKIIHKTSEILDMYDVQFVCADYKDIKPNVGDFVFMDPPYSDVGNGSSQKSMYHGGIDIKELIEYCNNLPCEYALTYDGDRGENKANRVCLDKTKIVNLNKKNSSYSRMNGKQVDVEEIMYLKINN